MDGRLGIGPVKEGASTPVAASMPNGVLNRAGWLQGKACGKHGEIIIFGALRETLGSGGWVRKGEQRLVAVPVVSAGRREKMT